MFIPDFSSDLVYLTVLGLEVSLLKNNSSGEDRSDNIVCTMLGREKGSNFWV